MNALRLAFLAVVVLFLSGCGGSAPPNPPVSESATTAPLPDDLTNVPPRFTGTAEELVQECQKDRAAADKKFANAVIELRGEVSGISAGLSGDAFVSLKAGSNLLGVSCAMVDREPWASVSKGQQVTIKGAWPGSRVGVSLSRCVIVNRGPSPAQLVTAEQLAAEYAADRAATINKYRGKDVIVTGVIAAKEKTETGTPSVCLKGTEKIRVDCGFGNLDNDRKALEPLTAGQPVKVVGELLGIDHTERSVALRFCHLITR
jgi:hypothetical protein